MDELAAFRFAPRQLQQREAALLRRADVVFTGGRSLYRAKRDRHHDVWCFPSCVDAHTSRRGDGWTDPVAVRSAVPRSATTASSTSESTMRCSTASPRTTRLAVVHGRSAREGRPEDAAATAQPALAGTARLRVVATSRRGLGRLHDAVRAERGDPAHQPDQDPRVHGGRQADRQHARARRGRTVRPARAHRATARRSSSRPARTATPKKQPRSANGARRRCASWRRTSAGTTPPRRWSRSCSARDRWPDAPVRSRDEDTIVARRRRRRTRSRACGNPRARDRGAGAPTATGRRCDVALRHADRERSACRSWSSCSAPTHREACSEAAACLREQSASRRRCDGRGRCASRARSCAFTTGWRRSRHPPRRLRDARATARHACSRAPARSRDEAACARCEAGPTRDDRPAEHATARALRRVVHNGHGRPLSRDRSPPRTTATGSEA